VHYVFWWKDVLSKPNLAIAGAVTQTAEAVKSLITYHNHGHEPAEMPAFYRLTAEMVLVQSNKKDVYYVVTPRSCSCPSGSYETEKPCKHQRKYFPQPKPAQAHEENIRPAGKWSGGHNGPVLEVA
jgi:hypothetical protein